MCMTRKLYWSAVLWKWTIPKSDQARTVYVYAVVWCQNTTWASRRNVEWFEKTNVHVTRARFSGQEDELGAILFEKKSKHVIFARVPVHGYCFSRSVTRPRGYYSLVAPCSFSHRQYVYAYTMCMSLYVTLRKNEALYEAKSYECFVCAL